MTVTDIAKLTGRPERSVRTWVYSAATKEKDSKLLTIHASKKEADFNAEYLFKILKAGLGEQIASAYMIDIHMSSLINLGLVAESFNKFVSEFFEFRKQIKEENESLKQLITELIDKEPLSVKDTVKLKSVIKPITAKIEEPKPHLSLFKINRQFKENRIGVRFFSCDRPEIKVGDRVRLDLSGHILTLEKGTKTEGYNLLRVNKRGIAFNGLLDKAIQNILDMELKDNTRYSIDGEIVNGKIQFNLDNCKTSILHRNGY